jgi:hypothetical protein
MIAANGILVASDLSERSTLALKRAAILAHDLGARLELLHVVEETARDFFFPEEQDSLLNRELIEAAWKRSVLNFPEPRTRNIVRKNYLSLFCGHKPVRPATLL